MQAGTRVLGEDLIKFYDPNCLSSFYKEVDSSYVAVVETSERELVHCALKMMLGLSSNIFKVTPPSFSCSTINSTCSRSPPSTTFLQDYSPRSSGT